MTFKPSSYWARCAAWPDKERPHMTVVYCHVDQDVFATNERPHYPCMRETGEFNRPDVCPKYNECKGKLMAHTTEQLKGKSLLDLRGIAKGLGINPSGKPAPELIKEIEKKQGSAPKAAKVEKPAAKAERTAPPAKAVKAEKVERTSTKETSSFDKELQSLITKVDALETTSTNLENSVNVIKSQIKLICEILVKFAAEVGIQDAIPENWTTSSETTAEAPAKRKPGRPKKEESAKTEAKVEKPKKAPQPESGTSTTDVGETKEVTAEDLALMDLNDLRKLAAEFNKKAPKGAKLIDVTISSPRDLRKAIAAFAEKHFSETEDAAEETAASEEDESTPSSEVDDDADDAEDSDDEDEDEKSEDTEDSADGPPSFVKVGARVLADFGEGEDSDWIEGTITKVIDEESVCVLELDEKDDNGKSVRAKAPWGVLRVAKKAKAG